MINSIVLIQLHKTPDVLFEKPFLKEMEEKVPGIVTYDFDNFSEESIRQYALDLIGQSRKAAVMVQVKAEEAPQTGLVQFLNRLQQLKHPHLLMLQEGPLPPPLEKMLKMSGGSNYRRIQNDDEALLQLQEFLHTP
jgi:hypothetical protein